MSYLFVAGGSITFFILLLLLGKQEKSAADYALTGLIFVLLLNFVTIFLLNEQPPPYPKWKEAIFEFSEASIFLYGPLLWIYTLALTQIQSPLSGNLLAHFLPFWLAFLYLLLGVWTPLTVSPTLRNLILVLKLASIATYVLSCLYLLRRHEQRIQHLFSNLHHKQLTWLRFLCGSILLITAIATLSLSVDRFTEVNIPQYGGLVTNVTLCLFAFVLGYFGLRQEWIFHRTPTEVSPPNKYAKSGLDDRTSRQEYEKLKIYFDSQQPFLDAELTLFGLAEQLRLQPNHLSQIINSYSGSNFYDFVNEYRVAEAQRRIASPEVQVKTLLGIGLSCGFSSKATFNRAFKKHTGSNPSDYRKRAVGNK